MYAVAMRPHIIIKMVNGIALPKLPFWGRVIQDQQTQLATQLAGSIDPIFAKHQIEVGYAAEYTQNTTDGWTADEKAAGMDRTIRAVLIANHEIPPALLADLIVSPAIETVQKGMVSSAKLPTLISSQMSVSSNRAQQMIQLKAAHELTQGDPSITIAVLDTGVDLSHPELQHALVSGYDFVDIINGSNKFFGDFLGADPDPDDSKVGHGTHVAGIISSKGLDMPIGVAPKCKILPVRVLGAMKQGDHYVGAGLVDNINAGIKWAIDQGADVINMSLGIKHSGGGLPHKDVVMYAKKKGVTIVAASGNDGTQELYYPGALPHVISVGATNEAGQVAPFTTHGKVSIVAPGTEVYSSYIKDGYAYSSGTSQAAPFVAGLVALLKSYAKMLGKSLSDPQIKYILKHSSDRLTSRLKTQKSGYGQINALDALKLLKYKLTA